MINLSRGHFSTHGRYQTTSDDVDAIFGEDLERTVEFCVRHRGAVELHAVGHSAGAVFHASCLPAAFDQGVPAFKSLALLAPAIRVDRFHERLAPLIGAGNPIERVALFTMNKLRELDDNCIGIYRKSLLYLIHYTLKDQRETPILGLEVSLRADPVLKALFGAWRSRRRSDLAQDAPNARLRSQSTSITHEGFDDDGPTMDSLLRRILDRDQIRLSYARGATLAPVRWWGLAPLSAQPQASFRGRMPSPGRQQWAGTRNSTASRSTCSTPSSTWPN